MDGGKTPKRKFVFILRFRSHSEQRRRGLSLLFALAMGVSCARSQTIPFQQAYHFGNWIPLGNSWAGPAFLELSPISKGPSGKVWLRQTPQGLLLFARTAGPSQRFARFPSEMAESAHISLWLALAPTVDMPEIGWGSQFGLMNCSKYSPTRTDAAMESCSVWSTRQASYREQLRRLFVRHWKLAPGVTVEDYASDAWRAVLTYANDFERRALEGLAPSGVPFVDGGGSPVARDFEIFVPWSAFPPSNSLTVSGVRLAVDIVVGEAGRSTTAPERKGADPATFNNLDLERPLVSRVSPCGYPLQGFDVFHNGYPAWYFLDPGGTISDTFVLRNDIRGYRYDPEGLSPIPSWTHYFSKEFAKGERICGPALKYETNTRSFDSEYKIDSEHLAMLEQPGDTWLLRSGPATGTLTELGAGECGSCGTLGVSVYRLSPEAGITLALKAQMITDSLTDADIQFSPDWKIVTLYRASLVDRKPAWTFERYCLAETTYRSCGSGQTSAPPAPRQFTLPRTGV